MILLGMNNRIITLPLSQFMAKALFFLQHSNILPDHLDYWLIRDQHSVCFAQILSRPGDLQDFTDLITSTSSI
jgi:hypothetical protein